MIARPCSVCSGPIVDGLCPTCAAAEAADTDSTKPSTRLPHGYASDLLALRRIVSLYSEATIDALSAYWSAPIKTPEHVLTLDRWSDLGQAAAELASVWASLPAAYSTIESRLASFLAGSNVLNVRRRTWFESVFSDVRARLAGDMGRPLPTSPVPEQLAQVEGFTVSCPDCKPADLCVRHGFARAAQAEQLAPLRAWPEDGHAFDCASVILPPVMGRRVACSCPRLPDPDDAPGEPEAAAKLDSERAHEALGDELRSQLAAQRPEPPALPPSPFAGDPWEADQDRFDAKLDQQAPLFESSARAAIDGVWLEERRHCDCGAMLNGEELRK